MWSYLREDPFAMMRDDSTRVPGGRAAVGTGGVSVDPTPPNTGTPNHYLPRAVGTQNSLIREMTYCRRRGALNPADGDANDHGARCKSEVGRGESNCLLRCAAATCVTRATQHAGVAGLGRPARHSDPTPRHTGIPHDDRRRLARRSRSVLWNERLCGSSWIHAVSASHCCATLCNL